MIHSMGGSFSGTIASGTLTADGPGLTITQTWNNVATGYYSPKDFGIPTCKGK